MTDSLDDTMQDRKATHGDFSDHAFITQGLKATVQRSASWHRRMTDEEREALDMILHKIGRICAGNPHHADHWFDIEGYARICRERLPK